MPAPVRSSWPARDRQDDDRRHVVPRTASSDDVYDQGYADGRRHWRQLAIAAMAVAGLWMLVTAVLLVRWWQTVT